MSSSISAESAQAITQEAYLNASFDEMETQYGIIENYFAEGLGIDADEQQTLCDLYLV